MDNNNYNSGQQMARKTLGVLLSALLILVSFSSKAATQLNDIYYNTLLADEVEFTFGFDSALTTEPEVKTFTDPARIQITFDAEEFVEPLAQTDVNHAGIKDIQVRKSAGKVTADIYLDDLKLYQSGLVEGKFVILLNSLNSYDQVPTPSNDESGFINNIQAIDFRKGDAETGQVLVFLDDSKSLVDVKEVLGKIEMVFHNTSILDDLLYKLDVTDFGTLVTSIETFKEGDNARIQIETDRPFSFEHNQVDNIFSLSVKELEEKKSYMENGEDFNGKAISLNFQDIPIRTVLQIIADYNGFNLVTSDTVAGNITLRLDGVPWDQALDIILKVKGLGKRMDGNILMIAPNDELIAREARDLQAQQQVSELAPLYSEYVQVNYAKAASFAGLLKNEGTSLLSERGSVTVDERTNTLLIRDTAKSIEDIKRMVGVLDIPIRQVVIESRMVTVKDNISEDLGIRWGVSEYSGDRGISGTLEGGLANMTSGGDPGSIGGINDRLNVNLPIAEPAGTIAFQVARLADGTILDLELSALEQENKGEIIASPRITTSNQKEAYIEQGTEIPFVQAASSGATSVTFKKAVLGLRVTPQITPDNRIILDLVITQDTRGDTVQTGTGQATAIDTQEIATQVLVNNGETIVLGGIYQQQIINAVSKVPVLGDIPYVGWLFRTSSEFNEKKELLIFVTPRIVTETL
ncbi:type IV pilus secretin PilQ [Thalassotalea mangrovi]|uniref:Type IV pilus secretin PilQ family protein n=1 Tax=Thalassotalea mangrovi TaxID=2572245 RepID=A0A4U1B8V9_9GAMM|nr:type IV pilus secretin PilQ family protein [Thalassotalea mangrovi]TKB46718.1 type IV pilus secretin PilQ family protein [Thalassotalea mangrovi]